MNQQEYKTFIDAWSNAHEIMPGGKQLSAGAMKMVVDVLTPYPLDFLLLAIDRHVKTGKFAPTPKDLIDMIEHGNRHISADEAWAIVLESFDEFETVVMTKEIAEARMIAFPIWQEGDKVGARMAFKTAYDRIVLSAPGPQWFVSEGFDKEKRSIAVMKAVQLGRIGQDVAAKHLPPPMDGGPIGKLLTGKVTHMPTNNATLAERWHELGQAIKDGMRRLEEEEFRKREQKRLNFEEKRQAALAAVQRKLESMGMDK